MSRTGLTALTLVATALTASGCGGSTKSSESTEPLTHVEFVAKADVICGRVNAERASTPMKSRQDFERILPRIAADEQTAVAELDKLTPPASMAADWKQIVTADRTLAGYTGRYGQYLASDNNRAARALLQAAGSVQRPMVATAKRDGFNDCTQFGS
jgi:hypothetical protein